MKKAFIIFCLIFLSLFRAGKIRAATVTPALTPTGEASVSATIVPTEVPAVKENITEPRSKEVSYRLESVLESQQTERWNGWNTMKIIVRWAVSRGVAANTIVLLLLLPVVATWVSVLHYVFGLSGYGIFMPTIIAVTFLATGIFGGLVLFAMILLISVAGGLMLKRLKMHFWPARSINLMFISLGTFGLMIASSYLAIIDIRQVSIFPILFMILLAEEFVRTQLVKSKKEAKRLTLGTLILSIGGALTMNIRGIQEMVLLHPEVVILIVLVVNLLVGNYTGIRLVEIERFGKAIRKK